jgi:hypothetical protein
MSFYVKGAILLRDSSESAFHNFRNFVFWRSLTDFTLPILLALKSGPMSFLPLLERTLTILADFW